LDVKVSYNDIPDALRKRRTRNKVKRLAVFMLKPNSEKFNAKDEELIKRTIKDIQNDPDYFSWKEGSEKNIELKELESNEDSLNKSKSNRLNNLRKEHEEYKQLKTLLEGYIDLQNGIANETA